MEDSAGDGLTKAIEAALHGRRNISNNKSQRLTIAEEGRNFNSPTTKDTGNAGGAAAVASMHAGLEAAEALRHLSEACDAREAALVRRLALCKTAGYLQRRREEWGGHSQPRQAGRGFFKTFILHESACCASLPNICTAGD
jgi:hypothetical protein